MMMGLAKNKKWKKCPRCSYYVELASGCLHIRCRCGHEFCYGCGKTHNDHQWVKSIVNSATRHFNSESNDRIDAGGHVAAKIQENITTVRCPDPNCKGIIGPEACRLIVPKEVLDRWEDALCESLILGAEKFYCPFKDCSAMLVNDGGEAVTSSECPHCYRLFCAQCKVANISDSVFFSMQMSQNLAGNWFDNVAFSLFFESVSDKEENMSASSS
uniref:RBR-type E3 ubiquitin transferase n=1 Tax=Tanacetum cinerariifolium TaxID=118510 RepID=A0A6L2KEG5_TANCI|nr:zinc finger, C6HC-type [Tanacetum cinerariifolium]